MLERCAGASGPRRPRSATCRERRTEHAGPQARPEALDALLTVDAGLWRKETTEIGEYLAKFGERLPAALVSELQKTEAQLR
jgi:phosphoenolpyruvate carboxykinase (GTP)